MTDDTEVGNTTTEVDQLKLDNEQLRHELEHLRSELAKTHRLIAELAHASDTPAYREPTVQLDGQSALLDLTLSDAGNVDSELDEVAADPERVGQSWRNTAHALNDLCGAYAARAGEDPTLFDR